MRPAAHGSVCGFALGAGLGAIPGMALAVGMFFMPESPRWLVEQDREDDARKVLCHARRKEQVDDELDEIRDVAKEEGGVRDWAARRRELRSGR